MADTKKQVVKEKQPKKDINWLVDVMPKIKSGSTIKVHQKVTEKGPKGEDKTRTQIFEGIVLSHKGGAGKNASITVRKVAAGGIGVERIFPIHSPNISTVELVRQAKIKQAKSYYLRDHKKKLKEIKL